MSDIFTTVKFQSAVYFKHSFCGQWGMDIKKGDFAQFHLITNGHCLLKVKGQKIHLNQGDIAIFPNGLPHKIMSADKVICRNGQDVVADILAKKEPYRDGVTSANLICGHYEMKRDVQHPIFEELPEYLIIKRDEYGRFDTIQVIFELITEEMNRQSPGYQIISLKMAEVLFVSIIRHYYIRRTEKTKNLFSDKTIYQTVNFIHKEISSKLNLENLAKQAGLSRTLFIQRFKKALGTPPLSYVKQWRMTKAKFLLHETELSIQEIGFQIGYPSIPSFIRVFKQTYGTSPAKYRRIE